MSVDVLSIVARCIEAWKKSVEALGYNTPPERVEAISSWIMAVVARNGRESRVTLPFCEVTGDDGKLERHHLAGRKFKDLYPQTVTVCLKIHSVLSLRQTISYLTRDNGGSRELMGCAQFLQGLRDLLNVMGDESGEPAYYLLADMLIDEIVQLLRR